MANSTNIVTVTVRQQDVNGTDIIAPAGTGRAITFTFAGNVGLYEEEISIGTGGLVVQLPISPLLQLFVQNLDPSNYLTVTWTPNGGSSNVVKQVRPGGFIAFSDLDTSGTAGITALTLQANTAAVKVRMFLGG